MNNRLLRPIVSLVTAFLLRTLAGEDIVTQSGEKMRTIQNA